MRIQTGRVGVTGGNIVYKIFYTDASKNNTPLLVIHGGPAVPHQYLLPLTRLAVTQPVIFYDQLGCGESDKPNDDSLWCMPRFVEEVELICHSLNLTAVHIFGHSFGAAIAMEYALQHAENVHGLILASPLLSADIHMTDTTDILNFMNPDDKETILSCENDLDFTNTGYLAARKTYGQLFLCRMNPWPSILQESLAASNTDVRTKIFGVSPRNITGTIRGYDMTRRLSEIQTPMLVTCGEYDFPRPATLGNYFERLENAQLIIYAECSHMPHLEAEGKYLSDCARFLEEKALQPHHFQTTCFRM